MKFTAFLLLAATGASGIDLSPITRVVQLLKGLQEKAEVEQKKEEDLYETYVCWAKSVISSKTASNEKAESRIDSLETYVSDVKAGRIELTSERVDLEKEIAGLNDDIEIAKEEREKEKKDYEAAKGEMDAAVGALKAAIKVLEEATKDAKLISVHSELNAESESLESRVAQGQALERAIALGEQFLSHGDALFLKRLINSDVPKKDFKKLNKRADFKKKYKARSGGIQKTLKGLLFTFSSNLKEADGKEKKAKEEYKTLMDAKKEELSKAQDALEKMELEKGARGMTLEEAQSELKGLKKQVKNDKKYISQVEGELKEKKKEWKERKEVRSKEMEAISKAISILYSDDSRDLFKKSYESQGYMLLQENQKYAMGWRSLEAKAVILKAARAAKDRRLMALVSHMVKAGKGFDKVVTAIDKMIKVLKKEEEEDLKVKEECEKTRSEDTRDAVVTSRKMDDTSDTIIRLEGEIEDIVKEVKEKNTEIKEIKKELKEATEIRKKETEEFKDNKKDDVQAAKLVANARDVLKEFYKENSLLQQQPQFTSEAGEAPPPPPPTWEKPYKGKQQQSQGIVAILEMIEDDIKDDIKKAEKAEKTSQKKYDELKKESQKSIKDLEEAVDKLEEDKASKKKDVTDNKSARLTKKKGLKTLLKKIKDAESGCDFFAVNFEKRSGDRTLEIDGLIKARALLKGAVFDDFLQKETKRHS